MSMQVFSRKCAVSWLELRTHLVLIIILCMQYTLYRSNIAGFSLSGWYLEDIAVGGAGVLGLNAAFLVHYGMLHV